LTKAGAATSRSKPCFPGLKIGRGNILRRFTEAEALDPAGQWMSVYAGNARGVNLGACL
jgi:hypothetical protein